MAQGPINLSLFGSKVARGPQKEFLQFFFLLNTYFTNAHAFCTSVLTTWTRARKKMQKYRLSLVFITLIEELP